MLKIGRKNGLVSWHALHVTGSDVHLHIVVKLSGHFSVNSDKVDVLGYPLLGFFTLEILKIKCVCVCGGGVSVWHIIHREDIAFWGLKQEDPRGGLGA